MISELSIQALSKTKTRSALHAAIRVISSLVCDVEESEFPNLQFKFDENMQASASGEVADIKVNKPYKKRILKLDPVHRLGRQIYKLKSKNPAAKRKRDIYQKKYRQKNKMALKRRSEFVKKAKKRLPQVHRSQVGNTFPNKDYTGDGVRPNNINMAPQSKINDFPSSQFVNSGTK